jgi:hypothetical protein
VAINVVFPVPSRRAQAAQAGKPAVTHAWKPLPAAPVLGLIDNTKARARDLLEAIGRALVKRGVVGSYFVHSKPSPSYPITREVRAEIAARAHLIVSGVGD